MSDLILLRPWWLILLPVLLVMGYWVRHRRLTGGWASIIAPDLLPSLRRLGLLVEGGGHAHTLLPFAISGVIVLALAGPAMQRPGSVQMRELDPMILLLDLSPSVVVDPQVLASLQSTAAELLSLAGSRPVGMMVYAADGYLASAPTTDAMSLQGLIAVLDRDTVPVAGSRPDIALSMARDLFSSAQNATGIGGADLVLISDGGGAGPLAIEEAARLASDGARVWALFLDRNAQGAPTPSRTALQDLTSAGGGATLSASQAPDLIQQIGAARTARFARDRLPGQALIDLGPWLLPAAMLLLFPLFRRRQ